MRTKKVSKIEEDCFKALGIFIMVLGLFCMKNLPHIIGKDWIYFGVIIIGFLSYTFSTNRELE